MDFSFMHKYYFYFVDGTKYTLILAVFTVLLGTMLGLVLALSRLFGNKPIKFLASTYIEFVRGTPILVQLYIVYYGLPMIGIKIPSIPILGSNFPDFVSGILALAMNSAAYVAEIIRAGIQAVDKGQMEAARSLGMTNAKAMYHIIIPQAFKNILPALGNEFITVIKESSIVSIIGIQDLMFSGNIVRGATYQPFEPLIVVALIYFAMTFTLSKFLGVAERRMRVSDRG